MYDRQVNNAGPLSKELIIKLAKENDYNTKTEDVIVAKELPKIKTKWYYYGCRTGAIYDRGKCTWSLFSC